VLQGSITEERTHIQVVEPYYISNYSFVNAIAGISSEIFRYTMNIITLVHYTIFFANKSFEETFASTIRALISFGGLVSELSAVPCY